MTAAYRLETLPVDSVCLRGNRPGDPHRRELHLLVPDDAGTRPLPAIWMLPAHGGSQGGFLANDPWREGLPQRLTRLAASGDPLIENLFARELARPGPLGIGLAAAPDGTLSAAGRPPLFALGTPLRGMLAESSAVREIRVQALTVARAILAALEPAG